MATTMQQQTSPELLKERLQTALSQARQVCETGGNASTACKTAWETVAELGIATKAQEQQPFFSAYCDKHPGAAECKVYDT